MVTNIANKASEVRYAIDKWAVDGEEVTEIDVRKFVLRRWPDLALDVQERIVRAVVDHTDTE